MTIKRRRQQWKASRVPGKPAPPQQVMTLTAEQRCARAEILRVIPPEVQRPEYGITLDMLAMRLVNWRQEGLAGVPRPWVRDLYRGFGGFFIPMEDRRALLFPDRPKRWRLQ